jgi:membrane fusion protein, copper/silver efflux system
MKNNFIRYGTFFISVMLLLNFGCDNKKVHEGHEQVTGSMDMITLSKRDEQNINLKLDTVKMKSLAEYTTVLGTTTFDERKITVVASRVNGRLDKVFVQNGQQWISRGQSLYAIYSEELLSYENELINSLEQKASFTTMQDIVSQLVESARKKLLLWGLTPEQVEEIERTRKASSLITFYSLSSGTLLDVSVTEGQFVQIGTPLYKVADLSQLWVEGQVYANELHWLNNKASITVELDAYPGEVFHVTPVFDNPVIEPNQKISLVRFLLQNRNGKLKPGMMAYISIKRNEKNTLVIPKSALLVGAMTTVWLRSPDGMYEPRNIETGMQNKNEVEVKNGLTEGEIVVSNGAYLINSANILKKGADIGDMKGMKM